jgi:hypothetical protein
MNSDGTSKLQKMSFFHDFKNLCTLWDSIVMNKYSPQDFTTEFIMSLCKMCMAIPNMTYLVAKRGRKKRVLKQAVP